MSTLPIISFWPALPLVKTLAFDEWLVGPLPSDVLWRPDPFKRLSLALLDSFGEAGHRGGAVLWHRDRGIDGTTPDAVTLAAVYAAVAFATLDANDRVARDDPNGGHYLATTENAALFVQPVDEAQEWVTHIAGGVLRRVMTAGWRIGEKPLPLPDAVVPIGQPRPVSAHLAKAVFDYLKAGGPDAARVATAMEWHRSALANSEAVSLQQRLIALKTGFEVLTGTDQSFDSARRLRELFERVTQPHGAHLPWAGILYEPTERRDVVRTYTKKNGTTQQDKVSEFEHWFMALADARNDVIHRGTLGATDYPAPPERPLSRYAGPFFWTGERVLREVIKAMFGADVLLCGLLAEVARWQPVIDHVRSLCATDAPPSSSQDAVEATAAPSRSLAELLAALNARAANTVQVDTGGVRTEAGEDGAISFVNRAGWAARANDIEMYINEAEKKMLLDAGAEEALSEYYEACE